MNLLHICPSRFRHLAAAVLVAAFSSSTAWCVDSVPSDEITRLSEVEVTTTKGSQAPTDIPLKPIQPQSEINLDYISKSVAPTADYATIANIAPSVSNVETNGPGLSESKHLTLRGFDDASYNVTMDGIPFSDYNTFSHHSTSYFPAKLVGSIVVDRGPGTASTIGYATFGGTIAMYSKDPRTDTAFIPTLSFGSWNTQLRHYEVNSGTVDGLNGASLIASYQIISTDGYRTFSEMKRDTYYLKYLQPVGKNTMITFMGSYNNIHFSNPGTVTQEQMDFYGRNFGLTNNAVVPAGAPSSLGTVGKPDTFNKAFNFQEKQADFYYLGLDTKLGTGWNLADKVYTYYYNNISHESPKIKTVSGVDNVVGSLKANRYRTVGDYFVLSNKNDTGTFKVGAWWDKSRNLRYLYGLNYTASGTPTNAIDTSSTTNQFAPVAGNPNTAVGAPYYNYSYHLVDTIHTLEPFADYDWHVTQAFSINPGVKFMSVTRDMHADVLQTKARLPLFASRTDSQVLPFLSTNYLFTDSWSAYAQVAKGFLAPSEKNAFYVTDLTTNNVKPQYSTNYQLGTVWKSGKFNADADVYYIDFKNYEYSAGTDPVSGDPIFFGVAQGAHYSGVEAQASYVIGGGVSVYANGSLNKAKFKGSDIKVPQVPVSTAAIGLNYSNSGFFASVTDKYVGSWTVYDTITNPDIAGGGASRQANSSSYWLTDASIGYGLKFKSSFIHNVKIRFQVSNLFDKKVQVLDGIDSNPANAYTKDTFNVLPERNYYLTLSAEF